MRRTITGFSNPTVKFLRSLRDKKHRKQEGKFLAEGLRLLTDARESGCLPETLVMATGREAHPLLDALEAEVTGLPAKWSRWTRRCSPRFRARTIRRRSAGC